jgi:LacI family transcriptional regulator
VTQLDIARVAGVHNTTVSMALRNSPAIPEATRRRIQALAENMGYTPDPALRALNAYRNGRRPPEKLDTIGYITDCASKLEWQNMPEYAHYYAGAMRRAGQLGFQLEHFWLGEPGMSVERLSTVFFHRRINGAIFAPYSTGDSFSHLGWNRICAVKIGLAPRALGLHSVAADHTGAIRLAVKQAISHGYRRIGIVMPPRWDKAVREALTKSFLAEQRGGRAHEAIALLQHDFADASDKDETAGFSSAQSNALRTWMLSQKPDLVISLSPAVAETLVRLGYSIPEDIGFLELSAAEHDSDFAGVRQNCEHVGAVAVEKLVALMQQNQSGIPTIPTTTFVEPSWIEGSSLRMHP